MVKRQSGKNYEKAGSKLEFRIGFLPVLLYAKRGEETKSAFDLASALCAYIKSPNMRTMHGKEGRTYAEKHFSIEKMVKNYVAVYRRAADPEGIKF